MAPPRTYHCEALVLKHVPFGEADLAEIREVCLTALTERGDLHRAPQPVLLWLLANAEEEARDEAIADFLKEGVVGTRRLQEIDAAAGLELQDELRRCLGSEGIRPWLPPELLKIARDSKEAE